LDSKGIITSNYNDLLLDLANTRAASGDRVVVVDQESALNYPGDMADGLHPNDAGYAKMADVWYAKLQKLLSGSWVSHLALTESITRAASGDLVCNYTLVGPAVSSATAWNVDGAPWMRMYLPMEGGSANGFLDYSGNGLTPTFFGDPTWSATAGVDGFGAIEFDGNDAINYGENFPTLSSYTKTAWVYRTANGGNNIITGDTNGGGHAFWCRDSYGNRLSAGHNQNWDMIIDPDVLTLNTWHFVAVSYDRATHAMVLYKNGNVVDSITVPVADRDVTDPTITVGGFGSAGFNWNGTIDDARVFDVALTPEQIASMYTTGPNAVVPGETINGESWQCGVTPFTATDAGSTGLSNALTVGPCIPDCSGKECGSDGCGGLCGTCGFGEVCNADTCGIYTGPSVNGLQLSSTSGNDETTDDLTCLYSLAGPATTAATAWYLDDAPIMRLYLPMEGGASNAVLDQSGNGLTVNAVGSPTWSASGGHDGHGAFEFDGNESLYGGENFPTSASYTKIAWVYRTGSGSDGGNNIISGDANAGGHAFWAPDTYSNRLSAGHNGNWNIVQDSVALTLNTWFQVAVTYDHTTGAMVLYKNGAAVDSATVPVGDRAVSDSSITVGAFHTQTQFAWLGRIDDARIYTSVLSPEQIASLYSGGAGNQDIVVAAETADEDAWQCRVTAFSNDDIGPEQISNTVYIGGACVPDCTGKECGDDGCMGSCGTCGGGELCNASGLCVLDEPLVDSVVVDSSTGSYYDTDELFCSYALDGSATTAATAWSVDGSPWMAAYLPFEGGAANALLDYSGNANHGTVGGDPTWLPNGGHDGNGCFDFDGNDHIDLGNALPLPTYSKVAWVRYIPGETYNNIISGQSNHAFWVENHLSAFRLTAGHNGAWETVFDPDPFPENTWVFVAVTYDGNTLALYRDGALVDSASGVAPINADPRAYIGSYSGGCCWFKGQIDDARIYSAALSPEQIGALYAGGTGDGDTIAPTETLAGEDWACSVTPFSATEVGTPGVASAVTIVSAPAPSVTSVTLDSTSGFNVDEDDLTCSYALTGSATSSATAWYFDGSPFMRLYLPMEGGATGALADHSGNATTVTPDGDPSWALTGGHDGHGAIYFDGNDALLAGENFPTASSYTKSAWVYRTGSGTNGGNNIITGDTDPGGHAFWAPDSYGNLLSAGHNGNWSIVQDSVPLALNTWYHVAVTYDQTTHTMVLYRNGAIVDSAVAPVADQTVTDATLAIGSFGTGGYRWAGWIDEARVYARALSPEQIAALYAGGAGDGDTIVAEETAVGDNWQCRVTPFSSAATGSVQASNTVTIIEPGECLIDDDCDDGYLCTTDVCSAGVCEYAPVDCGSQVCDPQTGNCVDCLVPADLLVEDFDAYSAGDDPTGWYDTDANNALVENDALFDVKQVGADLVFGTDSTATNIHSHYIYGGSGDWSNYEYTGRMRMSDASGAVGVTFYSDYPLQDAYYRVRRLDQAGFTAFHLDQHPDVSQTLIGDLDSGYVPAANQWVRFHIRVQSIGGATHIQARLWDDGATEPTGWQIDATDSGAMRLAEGAVGVWSFSSGSKYWDDLTVTEYFDVVGGCDDGDGCTVDVCSNSVCVYEPLDCSGLDETDCVVGVCVGTTGVCAGELIDCDSDTVCDADDNCPSVANTLQEDADLDDYGDACDAMFDTDHDGDIDNADLLELTACLGGPDVVATPACQDVLDADLDADVDLLDFHGFQQAFTGSIASPCE
jgi:hypothetical protein